MAGTGGVCRVYWERCLQEAGSTSQGMAVPVSLSRGKWLLSSIVTIPLQAADKGSRKRYEPGDKERPTSPPAKRANLSPDRGEASASPGFCFPTAGKVLCRHPNTSEWDWHQIKGGC